MRGEGRMYSGMRGERRDSEGKREEIVRGKREMERKEEGRGQRL
jgi:hypothetical protein